MATHAQNIENLRTAVYGEQVRQSMIQLFEEDYTLVSNGISIGTAVTSASSSTTGYSDGNVYINSNTLNVYKLVSPSWTLVGNLKGIADITAIESSADGAANVVTFTLTDGTTKSFSIKNGKTGAQGVSVSNAVDNGDGTFKLQLSDGTQTSNVATIKGDRGTGIKRTIDNNDGTFKFELTDGTYTNDVATIKGDTGNTGKGVASITATGTGKNHILSANFTDGTSNIICTVKDGADGSGVGDMLKSVYDPLDKGYVTAAEGVTDGTFTATYATIDGKADKGTSLSDYGILDAYTKSEVDAKVGTGNIIDSVSADFDIVNKELELSTSMIGRVSNLDINGKISSSKVKYDNTVSQLSSTDVKGAIDEVTNRLSTIDENGQIDYSNVKGTKPPTDAQKNVQSDWSATSGDAFIKNKPTIPTITDTYSSTSTNGMSGKAVASAISNIGTKYSGSWKTVTNNNNWNSCASGLSLPAGTYIVIRYGYGESAATLIGCGSTAGQYVTTGDKGNTGFYISIETFTSTTNPTVAVFTGQTVKIKVDAIRIK